MATLKKVNFQLTTPYIDMDTRDFDTDVTFDPTKAASFVDGEWVKLGVDHKIARSTGRCTGGLVMPIFAPRGQGELQALGKCPVLWRGSFEVRTNLLEEDGIDVGKPVTVVSVADYFGDGQARAVLSLADTADDLIVGWCTRKPAAVTDLMGWRFMCQIGGFSHVSDGSPFIA